MGEAHQHGGLWRALAGPTRAAQGTLPVLLRAVGCISNTDTGNLSCFSFPSGYDFIGFFPLSFSTQAINERVMPAGLLHYPGSRQSSLDTSSYRTASCRISMGCLINTANTNDKLGGDTELELCIGIFQPKKITVISEQFYVLSPCCS